MGVWGGRWGDGWRSETRESGASLTNAPYGTYVTEAAEAAPPFTFHLSRHRLCLHLRFSVL